MKTKLSVSYFLLGLVLYSSLFAQNGQLIIFQDNKQHPVNIDFKENILPEIETQAMKNHIDLEIVDPGAGLPQEVRFTPAIWYQNHKGRSLYIGRYHHLNKIRTFVRTVAHVPQEEVRNMKKEVMVWQNGRLNIIVPMKITELDGILPENIDQEKFHRYALQQLAKGTKNFHFQDSINIRRSDRVVYTALYPYVSADGRLFLSSEIYSRFNCIEPIFRNFEVPVEGSWKKKKKALRLTGALIEEKIIEIMNSAQNGDGFIPVSNDAPVRSWEELGFSLPEKPEDLHAIPEINTVISGKWEYEGPVDDLTPVIEFHFLPPLEYYLGEINVLEGLLDLGSEGDIARAKGTFSAPLTNLTMGDDMLDEAVYGMLGIKEHPSSVFQFQKISVIENAEITFGHLTQFEVNGNLDFMGIFSPVDVRAQIQPIVGNDSKPRLEVYATFSLRLKEKYKLKGPDGPEPANDTVQFDINFLLKAAV